MVFPLTAPRIRHALVCGLGLAYLCLAWLSVAPVQAAWVVTPQTQPAASHQWLQPLQQWWETMVTTALSAVPLPNSAPNPTVTNSILKSNAVATGWNPVWLVKHDLIRVGLSDDAMEALEYPTTRVGATTPWQLWDANTPAPIKTGSATEVVNLRVTTQGFFATVVPVVKPANATSTTAILKEVGPFVGPLRLIPANEAGRVTVPSITRRGQVPQFKGVLEVVRGYSAPNKLTTVNVVGLQDYLKAVVPNELPPRYGFEAVKAQSIAARNYAIRPREKPWPSFDICDSQYCQVYFGAQTEHPTSNRAVDETEGLVALYEGRPILALFSSSHGGHSESYENAFADGKTFPAEPIPYLRGRADTEAVAQFGDLSNEANAQRFWGQAFTGDYDIKTAYHRWERVWTVAEFSQALKTQWPKVWKDTSIRPFIKVMAYTPPPGGSILGAAYPIAPLAPSDLTTLDGAAVDTGTVQRVDVVRRGVSGKAMTILITTTTGQFQVSREFVIRKLLTHQGKMLPSANIVVDYGLQPDGKLATIRVRGGGFGHGVGLSQIGASTLSDEGYSFDLIVQHYYTGVSLGSMPVAIGQAPTKTLEASQQSNVHIRIPLGTSQARLVVASPTPGPVVVSLNGQLWTIPLGASALDTFPQSSSVQIASNLSAPEIASSVEPKAVTASLFDWLRGGTLKTLPSPAPATQQSAPAPLVMPGAMPSAKPTLPLPPKTTAAILATWLSAATPLPNTFTTTGSRHTLMLVPDPHNPQRPVRAWLELIPPRAQPLKRS